jgi:hypothetical protein
MTVTAEALKGLNIETPREEIKKRPVFNKQKEKVGELDYVDARYCMDLLDEVVGPANWQDKYREVSGGIAGAVGILIDGEWVWKEDVGTESTIEPVKGNYSDAFKRACVKWGIARDLYDTRAGNRGHTPHAGEGQSTTRARAATGKPRNFPVPKEQAPWVCPEHDAVVAWPAGKTASDRAYDAFYACPKGRDCSHRAPKGLKVKPEHLGGKGELDDLPF